MFISIVSLSAISLHPLFLQNLEANGNISNGLEIANIMLEGMDRKEAKLFSMSKLKVGERRIQL
ncbi:hypothetical protein ACFSBH_07815 [Oceanobacillus luteolus]|uniref:Uncharacterized protein n=1 Tax=Oceanobacillus luteolus TaxID=1274358 RepID=A0ABW4HPY8_9BACI